MSTPVAAAATPAVEAAKEVKSESSASHPQKPAREGVIGEVSKEVTSEVTADGMRIETNCQSERARPGGGEHSQRHDQRPIKGQPLTSVMSHAFRVCQGSSTARFASSGAPARLRQPRNSLEATT